MSRDRRAHALALGFRSHPWLCACRRFRLRHGPTPLVAAARERGVAIVDGLDILVAQGALSFERWTGQRSRGIARADAATAEGGRDG